MKSKVIIVGSGPSNIAYRDSFLTDIKRNDVTVIAVNGAIYRTGDTAHYWFTLDPSLENRKIMIKQPYQGVEYVAAVPHDYGKPNATLPFFRRKRPKNVLYLNRIHDPNAHLGIMKGLSDEYGCINTGNSVYGALNFAYHFNPDNILLVGVDGQDTKRFDGTHSTKNIFVLPELMESVIPQLKDKNINVYNSNPNSFVTCFPHKTIQEFINL